MVPKLAILSPLGKGGIEAPLEGFKEVQPRVFAGLLSHQFLQIESFLVMPLGVEFEMPGI
jgi:hypothetical protein